MLKFFRRRKNRLWAARAIRVIALVAMVVQLIAIDNHNHDLTVDSAHCLACHFSTLFAGNAPASAPQLPAAPHVVIVRSTPNRHFLFVQSPRFLIPYSHAPPYPVLFF